MSARVDRQWFALYDELTDARLIIKRRLSYRSGQGS